MVREGDQPNAERSSDSANSPSGTAPGDSDEDPDEPSRQPAAGADRTQNRPKTSAAQDVLQALADGGPATLHELRCRLGLSARGIATTANWLHDRQLVSFALNADRAIVVSTLDADDAPEADDAA